MVQNEYLYVIAIFSINSKFDQTFRIAMANSVPQQVRDKLSK
jgi:hypothetical protein